jgi:hypothetical protein
MRGSRRRDSQISDDMTELVILLFPTLFKVDLLVLLQVEVGVDVVEVHCQPSSSYQNLVFLLGLQEK